MSIVITTEDFIERSLKIHDNKYDYSLVEYINMKNPINIICNIHGVFKQKPRAHLTGYSSYPNS